MKFSSSIYLIYKQFYSNFGTIPKIIVKITICFNSFKKNIAIHLGVAIFWRTKKILSLGLTNR